MNRSTSSQESLSKISKWKEDKRNKKVEFFESKVEKEKIKVDASILNDYIYFRQTNEVHVIDKLK